MLTASRTAYVGLLILVLLLFMYSKKKARFIAVTCFLAIVLSASVPSMYKDRFISLKEVTTTIAGNEEPNGSVGGRWDLIRDAWLVFLKYPLFGCGMDSFKRIPFDEKPYRTIGETHNLLMQVLAETGLVGLFAFVFLLSNIWRILASTKRALSTMNEGTKYLNVLVETLQIIFLMKLLIGLIGQHSLYSNIWWFLGGLTVIAARLTKEFAAEASLAASPDELIGQKTLRDQAVSVAPKRSLSPDVT
jgi:O-antigen ligase